LANWGAKQNLYFIFFTPSPVQKNVPTSLKRWGFAPRAQTHSLQRLGAEAPPVMTNSWVRAWAEVFTMQENALQKSTP